MIGLIKFTQKDVDELIPIMRDAFNEDSRMHLNGCDGGPDGYDNGDFIRKWFFNPKATPYTIYKDNTIIGAIVLWIHEDTKNNFLGCIFIDPKYENQGIGKKVWDMVEQLYPDTYSWSTETPIFSHRNHNFYINKCGFHCVRIDNPKDLREGSFFFQKIMKK